MAVDPPNNIDPKLNRPRLSGDPNRARSMSYLQSCPANRSLPIQALDLFAGHSTSSTEVQRQKFIEGSLTERPPHFDPEPKNEKRHCNSAKPAGSPLPLPANPAPVAVPSLRFRDNKLRTHPPLSRNCLSLVRIGKHVVCQNKKTRTPLRGIGYERVA